MWRLLAAVLLLSQLDAGRGFFFAPAARSLTSPRRHPLVRVVEATFQPSDLRPPEILAGGEPATLLRREEASTGQPLRVMIAGGGIGGLCAALVLKKQGFDVQVFEKATSYKPFGGPIQIATNALESFRRIDGDVYARIMESATMIGDRTNGLKDGISNEWFATFDLLSPAQARNQEASVVIDRPVLQDILLSRLGDCVTTGVEVVGYEQSRAAAQDRARGAAAHAGAMGGADGGDGGGAGGDDGEVVVGILADGTRHVCDILVGSDGIWSKVRGQLVRPEPPVWSGYTCFAAIADVVPHDIEEVGYKVFLGSRKYFVSVDVGGGRIQWYAFLNIPPKSLTLEPEEMTQWLKETQFAGWSEEVHELLDNTPTSQVEQRDLYDRPPELNWASGRVCLLGDAAHPMMPNLGQGGGMAIEDALVLGQELRTIADPRAVPLALAQYNRNRALRAAAVQGMSRLSSAILFQYNHPTSADWSTFPPTIRNVGPRSLITRACQGFLQRVAFPLQFEFLFSFPGKPLDPQVFAAPSAGDFTTSSAIATNPKRRRYGPVERGVAERTLLAGMSLREWLSTYW